MQGIRDEHWRVRQEAIRTVKDKEIKDYKIQKIKKTSFIQMARITGFQPENLGSSPRWGIFFDIIINTKDTYKIYLILIIIII